MPVECLVAEIPGHRRQNIRNVVNDVKEIIYLSQQGQRFESAPRASLTVLIRLKCFSFHEGTLLLLLLDWASRDLRLTRGDEGTFSCGERLTTLGTSGRSSSLCLAESKTLRFLVPTFWQTFLCLSSDSTLNVLKQIGQGSRIICSTGDGSSSSLTGAGAGAGGGGAGAGA